MQSSEQKIKINKESKSKNVTVYVTVKGVTSRVATVSKEKMSRSASKDTNKKGNMLAKQRNKATAAEVIMCDDIGYDDGGGEGGTVANSLGGGSRFGKERHKKKRKLYRTGIMEQAIMLMKIEYLSKIIG